MAKRSRQSNRDLGSRFAWMLFGLSIGLVVAAAVYLADRSEAPAATAAPDEPRAAPAVEVVETPVPSPEEEPHPASRFDFFDILPTFEVVLPEVAPAARRAPVSIEQPGNYVLQAGSFTSPEDAERRKATLALLGIESTLQRAEIGGITYHRVIVGPTTDQAELNRTRRRVWEADIDAFLYKISE